MTATRRTEPGLQLGVGFGGRPLTRRNLLRGAVAGGTALASPLLAGCASSNGGGRQLRLVTDENDPRTVEVTDRFFAEFAKRHPGWEATGEYLSFDDASRRITTLVGAGDPPDLVKTDPIALAELAVLGQLEPVTDIVRELGMDDVQPQHRLIVDGEDYVVPTELNLWQLYYRKDWFEELGLAAPRTHEEYLATSQAVSDSAPDRYGNIMVYGPDSFSSYGMHNYLWSRGGHFFDWDGSRWTVVLDQDENLNHAVDILEWCKERALYSPNTSTYAWPDVLQAYGSGKMATAEYLGMRLMTYLHSEAPEIEEVTGAVALPNGGIPLTSTGGGGLAVVRKDGRDAELAKTLVVEFIQSKAYLDYLWTVPGHLIPVQDKLRHGRWLNHPYIEQNMDIIRVIDETIPYAYSALYGPENPEQVNVVAAALLAQPIYPEMIASVVLEDADPSDEVNRAADRMRTFQESLEG